jgi:hypothetical protein
MRARIASRGPQASVTNTRPIPDARSNSKGVCRKSIAHSSETASVYTTGSTPPKSQTALDTKICTL